MHPLRTVIILFSALALTIAIPAQSGGSVKSLTKTTVVEAIDPWVPQEQQSDEPRTPSATPTQEWTFHKTSNGCHPDGNEQAMMWLMNRARSNPEREGI